MMFYPLKASILLGFLLKEKRSVGFFLFVKILAILRSRSFILFSFIHLFHVQIVSIEDTRVFPLAVLNSIKVSVLSPDL